jgi:hypothetical protein
VVREGEVTRRTPRFEFYSALSAPPREPVLTREAEDNYLLLDEH